MDVHFMGDMGLEDFVSHLQADADAIRLLAMELDECQAVDMPCKAHTVYVLAENQLRLLEAINEQIRV